MDCSFSVFIISRVLWVISSTPFKITFFSFYSNYVRQINVRRRVFKTNYEACYHLLHLLPDVASVYTSMPLLDHLFLNYIISRLRKSNGLSPSFWLYRVCPKSFILSLVPSNTLKTLWIDTNCSSSASFRKCRKRMSKKLNWQHLSQFLAISSLSFFPKLRLLLTLFVRKQTDWGARLTVRRIDLLIFNPFIPPGSYLSLPPSPPFSFSQIQSLSHVTRQVKVSYHT